MEWLDTRQNFIARTGFRITHRTAGAIAVVRFSLNDADHQLIVDDEFEDLARDIPALSLEVLLRGADDVLTSDTLDGWRATIYAKMPVSDEQWRDMRQVAAIVLKTAGALEDQINDLDWQLNSGRAHELRSLSAA